MLSAELRGWGGGALVMLHDVQLAARFASRLLWTKDRRIVADGPTSETVAAWQWADIYGARARVEGVTLHRDGRA